MMFLKMLERSVSSIVPFPGDLFLDVFGGFLEYRDGKVGFSLDFQSLEESFGLNSLE